MQMNKILPADLTNMQLMSKLVQVTDIYNA